MEMKANCQMCGKECVGYVHVYQNRKKVKSIPVCLEHYAVAFGLIKIGQDKVRSFLVDVFTVKKGAVPRLKVSLTP